MKKGQILYLLVIILLVSTFFSTPVAAFAEPLGESDEDGAGPIVESLPPYEGDADYFDKAALGADLLPGDGVSADLVSVDSVPLSPTNHVDLFDKTPTFWFSQDIGAVKYKIEVWNVFNNSLVYTVKTGGNCYSGECSDTPITTLKNYVITGGKGYYAWRVYSKDPLFGWSSPSSFAYFYVNSTGFSSTFDIDTKKWLAVYGDWFRVDPGYLKTNGVTYNYASAVQKEWFADNYVYEVVMKRKVKVYGDTPSNRIYFMGYPGSYPSDGWDDGYEFYYYDDGSYYLKVLDGGVATTLLSGSTYAINQYGWNKLTVWTDYPYIDIWINQVYLGWTQIDNDPVYYFSGYVGVAGYKNSLNSSLLVDKAKLYYSLNNPYSAAMSVDGVHDPAYELTVDPNLVEPEG